MPVELGDSIKQDYHLGVRVYLACYILILLRFR